MWLLLSYAHWWKGLNRTYKNEENAIWLHITTEGLIEIMLHPTLTFVFSLLILQAMIGTVSNIILLRSEKGVLIAILQTDRG